MKKKTKKKIKRFLLLLVFFVVIFFFSFFFDKNLFNNLKDTVVKEVNSVKEEVKSKINEFEKYTNKKEEVPLTEVDKIELTNDLMVFFLDVGQADSILVKSQDEYMLIDAGNNADGKKLVNYFNSLGITKIKYVFGTHAHEDHIGGLDNIIKNFKIDKFYMPDVTSTTTTYVEVLNALEKKNIKYSIPSIGNKMPLGDSLVEVIYVGDETREDLNDTSIVLKLTYKNISFLFTGDLTNNVERELVNSNIESTVLKVGHHGSKYSSSAVFLNKVNPKYAVISCGKDNEYGHPHSVVLNKLERIGASVFRTDQVGTIIASSDGDKIDFKYINTDTDGDSNEKI